jgi:hypothetical protein
MLLQLYGLLGFMLNFTLIYDLMLMGSKSISLGVVVLLVRI